MSRFDLKFVQATGAAGAAAKTMSEAKHPRRPADRNSNAIAVRHRIMCLHHLRLHASNRKRLLRTAPNSEQLNGTINRDLPNHPKRATAMPKGIAIDKLALGQDDRRECHRC